MLQTELLNRPNTPKLDLYDMTRLYKPLNFAINYYKYPFLFSLN